MSTKKILRWARNAETGNVYNKAVLMILVAHADSSGLCDPGPSRATLVHETESSRTSVGKALMTLEELGLIERSAVVRDNGSHGSNAYWLVFDVDAKPQGWVATGPTPGSPHDLGRTETYLPTGPTSPGDLGVTSENAGGGSPHDPGGSCGDPLEVKEATSSSRARTHTRAREATNGAWKPTPEQLAKTATSPEAFTLVAAWRATHDPHYRPDTYTTIAHKVDEILSTGGSPDAIKAALAEWDRRSDAKPGLLPHLYDDALKARRAGTSSPALVNGRPTRPVDQIPDADIDPDAILGQDYWTLPVPPRELEAGPPEQLQAWAAERVADRRAERVVEARKILTRRQDRSAV